MPRPLTPHEIRVLGLAASGYSVAEMADDLGCGAESVKTHLKRAYRKLAARNRSHAVAVAMRRGLIA